MTTDIQRLAAVLQAQDGLTQEQSQQSVSNMVGAWLIRLSGARNDMMGEGYVPFTRYAEIHPLEKMLIQFLALDAMRQTLVSEHISLPDKLKIVQSLEQDLWEILNANLIVSELPGILFTYPDTEEVILAIQDAHSTLEA